MPGRPDANEDQFVPPLVERSTFPEPETANATRCGSFVVRILDFLDRQFGVTLGNADAIPDEWEERVGEPVQPAQIPDLVPIFEMQVQPHVEKLIGAEPRDEVGFEAMGPKALARDVVIALERRDAPTHRSLSQRDSAGSMIDANVFFGHR